MQVTTTGYTVPPRVEVLVSMIPAAAVRLTITRVDVDQTRTLPGSLATAGDTKLVVDWDAPTGSPLTYRVDAYDAAGTKVDTAVTTAAALPDPLIGQAWISDPLSEGSAVLAQLLDAETDRSRVRKLDSASFTPLGAQVPIQSIATARQAASLQLDVLADIGDAPALRSLLGQPILCVRPPSSAQLPPVFYGVADQVTEQPFRRYGMDASQAFSRFTLTLDATRAPSMAAVIARWTYQKLYDSYTYDQIYRIFGSYLDLMRGL